MTHDLRENSDDYEDGFFVHTSDGPRVMPSIVPDKAAFTQSVERIAEARQNGRPGCAVKVEMDSEVPGGRFKLLKASYIPEVPDSTLVGSKHRATLPPVDNLRIDFHSDKDGHAGLKANVSYSGDLLFEDVERSLDGYSSSDGDDVRDFAYRGFDF
jgi:hypothetical protein